MTAIAVLVLGFGIGASLFFIFISRWMDHILGGIAWLVGVNAIGIASMLGGYAIVRANDAPTRPYALATVWFGEALLLLGVYLISRGSARIGDGWSSQSYFSFLSA
jgi:hypothetical protein